MNTICSITVDQLLITSVIATIAFFFVWIVVYQWKRPPQGYNELNLNADVDEPKASGMRINMNDQIEVSFTSLGISKYRNYLLSALSPKGTDIAMQHHFVRYEVHTDYQVYKLQLHDLIDIFRDVKPLDLPNYFSFYLTLLGDPDKRQLDPMDDGEADMIPKPRVAVRRYPGGA